MEPVEIHIKREVFTPRAMVSIGLSMLFCLPPLYAYYILGTIDILHPIQSIYGIFGGLFSVVIYWFVVSIMLFCTLACRTTHYKVTNEILNCPADSLPLIFNKKSLGQAALHSISSGLLACVVTSMIGGRYADLVVTDQHSNRCLNEHKWFVVFFASVRGFVFSAQQSAFGGYSLQFSDEKPVLKRIKEEFRSILKSSTRMTRRTFVIYYPVYIILGGSIAWLLRGVLFLHDDLDAGLKTWWSLLDLALLYQTYIVGVLVTFIWTLSLFLFQICITKHFKFNLAETIGEGSLLSALELKQNNLTKMLAFKDLAMMGMSYNDTRRQRVFSLSMPGGHPKTWKTIQLATMTSLTELLTRIQTKHDQLVLSYKGIVPHSHQTSKIETLKPGFSSAPKLSTINQVSKSWYHAAILYNTYPDHLSGEVFNDSQRHLWSLSAISYLVSRSFSEDKYGIVQQSLGEIITLMLNLYQATENLFRVAPILATNVEVSDMNGNSHTVGISFRMQLKESCQLLAKAFHHHINDIYGLSSDHVKLLQGFA